jgi:cell division protein FtsL
MKKAQIVLLYFLMVTLPLVFCAVAWQSHRYTELKRETVRLESTQEEWVTNNRRLIARIASLSSPERVEKLALGEMGLVKKGPEEVLQIRITGGYRSSEP